MANDIYNRLREFMDKLPAGFPETPTGVEIKILEKMFTPEQAELTMKLSMEPESVSEIAHRTGMEEGPLAERLEKMARDGLIFRDRNGESRRYQAFHFLVGLYEFQLDRLDREFCELFEEYVPYFHRSMAGQTKQMRVIPVGSSLEVGASAAPYSQVKKMLEKEDLVAVSQCICRKERGILESECSKPREVCLLLGKSARYYLDNDIGRQVTKEEAFRILDLAEESGLVLSPSNSQEPEMICGCCTCCCPTLRLIKSQPNPGELFTSDYRSAIDRDRCTGCGACITVCPMDAIEDEDGVSLVLANRCIGCGLCTNRCPAEAVSMVERKEKPETPLPRMEDVRERITAERGLSK